MAVSTADYKKIWIGEKCVAKFEDAFTKVATGGVLWKKCSWIFCKIHRKTPAPESLI